MDRYPDRDILVSIDTESHSNRKYRYRLSTTDRVPCQHVFASENEALRVVLYVNRVCNASVTLPQKNFLRSKFSVAYGDAPNQPRQWIFSVRQWNLRLAETLLKT